MRNFITFNKKNIFNINKATKKERNLIGIIEKLGVENEYWDFSLVIRRVEEVFYIVQEALSIFEIDLAINYITKEFYKCKKIEFTWNTINNKRIVYSNLRIKKITLENIEKFKGKEDRVVFRIVAVGEEYIVNENSENRFITCNGKIYFSEYWTFNLVENSWMLDEIRKVEKFGVKSSFISRGFHI